MHDTFSLKAWRGTSAGLEALQLANYAEALAAAAPALPDEKLTLCRDSLNLHTMSIL